MAKIKFLQLSLLTALLFSSTQIRAAQIAIYNDGGIGVWPEGLAALEQFLKWKGISFQEVDAAFINQNRLSRQFDAICFPGGYAYYYKLAINDSGIAHIRELVSNGGGYFGICAGAYFACDSIIWEEDGLLDYPLDLFDGLAIGAIDSIAAWDNYTMTRVNLNANNPINQFEPDHQWLLYHGGPYFVGNPNVAFDTIGTWDAYHNLPAAINFTYGEGRVLLLGPHAEVEEDDDRDSTAFAQELDDQGSDWPFLWSAIDWLLGLPISHPDPSAVFESGKINNNLPEVYFFPNPFNDQLTISFKQVPNAQPLSIEIYSVRGQKVFNFSSSGQQPLRVTFKQFPSGVYFIQVKNLQLRRNFKVSYLK